ncbi:hypothetical protein GM708_07570 [Vibrio cholerae]|nr:hypothetical protein [Vibrio cholerae]
MITPAAAALLAQIFPTILIALAVEGRHSSNGFFPQRFVRAMDLFRYVSQLMALSATLSCIMLVITEERSVTTDMIVMLAGASLMISTVVWLAATARERKWGSDSSTEPTPIEAPTTIPSATTQSTVPPGQELLRARAWLGFLLGWLSGSLWRSRQSSVSRKRVR